MEGLPGHPVHRRRRGPHRGARAGAGRGRLLSAHARLSGSTPRRLVLLRHGRTASNAGGVMQGQLDVPLDEVGRAQAAAAAVVLAEARPTAVLSSDLARARDTAQALCDVSGLPLVLDPRLRELDLGRWQGLTLDEAKQTYPQEYDAWRAGDDVPRGGGETYREAGERAAACLQEALEGLPAGETLLVVTHGGTARAALGVLLEVEPASWGRFAPLGNTCWSVLVEASFGWRLERHNTGLGPLIGPATGAHDLGSRPAGGPAQSPDAEPVR